MHEPHTDRFDYDRQGHTYSTHRSTDPHIAGAVESALADAKTIVNVGAGTGSYEPEDLYVVAVEPSRTMRRQRLSAGRPPAVSAAAESLPFDDDAFDAAMAMITIHHWKDAEGGLRELRRVARDRVVIATFDPETLDRFWNVHYFPEMVERERRRYPTVQRIAAVLGEQTEVGLPDERSTVYSVTL